jgi:ribosomal protein S18 acetylase RimI-like enzyme
VIEKRINWESRILHKDATLDAVTKHDYVDLRALADTIWRHHYAAIISAAQVDYMLSRRFSDDALREYASAAGRWLEVLRVSGMLVGYCGYELADQYGNEQLTAMKLGQLNVLESHRGMGLGRFMLSHVESRARDLGRRVLFLQVNKQNTTAIGFYAAAGFTIAREAVFDIGSGFVMDDYVMEKRLNSPPAPAPLSALDREDC